MRAVDESPFPEEGWPAGPGLEGEAVVEGGEGGLRSAGRLNARRFLLLHLLDDSGEHSRI